MGNPTTIVCAFCQGTGKNPHFTGTCPVCKGQGRNAVVGPFMSCKNCYRTGQKRGTTLTCWTCGGLGIVPDRHEEFKEAKKEIEKARREMEEERREFTEGGQAAPPLPKADQPLTGKKKTKKVNKKETEETIDACPPAASPSGDGRRVSENSTGKIFCQCCGKKVNESLTVQVCLDCFRKIKGGTSM